MMCYRKILCISYKYHVTNKEVCSKIQQAVRAHEDILTIIKSHKLKWYGHISHSSSLAKTILEGTVKGGRRRGRQEKRCYLKILRISYKYHVTNEEVRAKIQQAIGPHEDLLTIV